VGVISQKDIMKRLGPKKFFKKISINALKCHPHLARVLQIDYVPTLVSAWQHMQVAVEAREGRQHPPGQGINAHPETHPRQAKPCLRPLGGDLD
jgi:hypothetical protein